MIELRFHGRGGQGLVSMTRVLALAAQQEGMAVQSYPFFGPERRGAPVRAHLRVSAEPIRARSEVYTPDLLVVMEPQLLPAALSAGAKEGTTVLLNTQADSPEMNKLLPPTRLVTLDASGMAASLGLRLGPSPMANVPMLGAIARLVASFPLRAVQRAVAEVWPRGDLALYQRALERGYEAVCPLVQPCSPVAPTQGPARGAPPLPDSEPLDFFFLTLSQPEPGSGGETGTWRSERPVVDLERCTHCLLCWLYCPEGTIEHDTIAVDYRYCKGCGICAEECPVDAIAMTREAS